MKRGPRSREAGTRRRVPETATGTGSENIPSPPAMPVERSRSWGRSVLRPLEASAFIRADLDLLGPSTSRSPPRRPPRQWAPKSATCCPRLPVQEQCLNQTKSRRPEHRSLAPGCCACAMSGQRDLCLDGRASTETLRRFLD